MGMTYPQGSNGKMQELSCVGFSLKTRAHTHSHTHTHTHYLQGIWPVEHSMMKRICVVILALAVTNRETEVLLTIDVLN